MNKQRNIKEKIVSGDLCLGIWLFIGSPLVAEALACKGYDWLCVDLEHTSLSLDSAQAMFVSMERHGAAPFARLSEMNPIQARRVLDSGAQGLFVPVVESAQDFQNFAEHCFYPPVGKRGVGLVRSNLWGKDFEVQVKDGFQPVLIPQIETKAGVENIEEILALECVDCVFAGPYDLSASLGVPGEIEHEKVIAALEQIKEAAEKAGKPFGYHQVQADPLKLKEKIDEGFTVIAYGVDLLALQDAVADIEKYKDNH